MEEEEEDEEEEVEEEEENPVADDIDTTASDFINYFISSVKPGSSPLVSRNTLTKTSLLAIS